MIKINLLGDSLGQAALRKTDKAEQQAEQVYAQEDAARRVSLPIAGLLVGLAAASAGLIYYLQITRKFERLEAQKAELEAQKAELEKYTVMYSQYTSQKEELKRKLESINKVKAKQEITVKLMQEIANSIPDNIWFDSLDVNGNQLTIVGNGGTFEAINIFRNKMTENTKWFRKVNQQSGERTTSRSVHFTISAEIVAEQS